MEQITLFNMNPPYKYIFDTCAILSQKDDRDHRRTVYVKLWENIDMYVQDEIIVTCSEVKDEIRDEKIIKWLSDNHCAIIDIDEIIQKNVIKVVTSNPRIIDFKKVKSSGDAFLIASAMKHSLTVVSEESKDSDKKIPQVCKNLGVDCINIIELCERENWIFR
jgi:hypothetical protein